MDFATLQAGIEKWLRTLVGTDPDGVHVPVRELEAPQTVAPNGVWCAYKIGATQGVGIDSTIYQLDEEREPGKQNVPEQRGNRRFTLEISVESTSQRGPWAARAFLERVRTRLRRPSSIKQLSAMNLGIISAEPLVNADRTSAERQMSKAVMDLHLNHTVREEDEDGATSVIETLEMSTAVEKPDGSPAGGAYEEHTIELTE
ncbi:MAG: phage neck terminator protein [Myxococcota bacterium]